MTISHIFVYCRFRYVDVSFSKSEFGECVSWMGGV